MSRINGDGYRIVYDDDGVLGNPGYPVLEHRLVMAQWLGHNLPKGSVVHHINGNRADNRIENLALMSNHAHSILHANELKQITTLEGVVDPDFFGNQWWLKMRCPECGTVFFKPKSQSFMKIKNKWNANFCSQSCAGLFRHKEEEDGLTFEMQNCLSSCVICEFKANGKFMKKLINGRKPSYQIDDQGNLVKRSY